MIRTYALGAALLACLGLGAGLWWVSGQRDAAQATASRLQDDLDAAQYRIDQAAEAAAVHRAYIERMAEQAAKAAQNETEALTMEGADAPLPAYLRTILDRVR